MQECFQVCVSWLFPGGCFLFLHADRVTLWHPTTWISNTPNCSETNLNEGHKPPVSTGIVAPAHTPEYLHIVPKEQPKVVVNSDKAPCTNIITPPIIYYT